MRVSEIRISSNHRELHGAIFWSPRSKFVTKQTPPRQKIELYSCARCVAEEDEMDVTVFSEPGVQDQSPQPVSSTPASHHQNGQCSVVHCNRGPSSSLKMISTSNANAVNSTTRQPKHDALNKDDMRQFVLIRSQGTPTAGLRTSPPRRVCGRVGQRTPPRRPGRVGLWTRRRCAVRRSRSLPGTAPRTASPGRVHRSSSTLPGIRTSFEQGDERQKSTQILPVAQEVSICTCAPRHWLR